jgi:hypothetical protein
VIRRAIAVLAEVDGANGVVEGDAEEEEEIEDEDEQGPDMGAEKPPHRGNGKKTETQDPNENAASTSDLYSTIHTPLPKRRRQASSSPFPFNQSSSVKDYSSELDMSSPPDTMGRWSRPDDGDAEEDDDDEDDEDDEAGAGPGRGGGKRRRENEDYQVGAEGRNKRKARPERTRIYEVVAVVRRKVVFALR